MVGIDLGKSRINDWSIPANYTWVSPQEPIPGRLRDWALAGSLHPGGCNLCMADGSTRFLAETTEQVIRTALATMAGGEAISAP
jgi:prepilin-type processing-associated H-X9-DG protein